jgi:hypothetical protein
MVASAANCGTARRAQSIAFQYAANLLPVLWVASLVGSISCRSGHEPECDSIAIDTAENRHCSLVCAVGALATSFTLSTYLGQLPWSTSTLFDVEAHTYDGATESYTRRGDQPDGKWLAEITTEIRQRGSSVLATGRIAAHLVGCEEVETVGQYLQRRQKLAVISSDQPPIGRYESIVLDLREVYQQRNSETTEVLQEANAHGFRIVHNEFEVVVLSRSK